MRRDCGVCMELSRGRQKQASSEERCVAYSICFGGALRSLLSVSGPPQCMTARRRPGSECRVQRPRVCIPGGPVESGLRGQQGSIVV